MAQHEFICPQCGQLFSARPKKCVHCGLHVCSYVDNGSLSDLIPGFRRLPKQGKIGVLLFLAFCLICCTIDMWAQLDKLHHFFHTRTAVPSWMKGRSSNPMLPIR